MLLLLLFYPSNKSDGYLCCPSVWRISMKLKWFHFIMVKCLQSSSNQIRINTLLSKIKKTTQRYKESQYVWSFRVNSFGLIRFLNNVQQLIIFWKFDDKMYKKMPKVYPSLCSPHVISLKDVRAKNRAHYSESQHPDNTRWNTSFWSNSLTKCRSYGGTQRSETMCNGALHYNTSGQVSWTSL